MERNSVQVFQIPIEATLANAQKMREEIHPIMSEKLLSIHHEKTFLFYDLKIEANFPNINNIIGKTKSEINLEELSKSPLCYHNEAAFVYLAIPIDKGGRGWGNNYASDSALNIFDCHVIDYVINHDEEKQIKISIIFFSLKREELLIPSVIKNDNSIIQIISRHILHFNNLNNPDHHNYQIDLLCKELDKKRILDLRFQGLPFCKTKLYAYQQDNIQWMIELEANGLEIYFSADKLFDLGSVLKLYFNYSNSCHEDCFISYDNFPKWRLSGGIICDETGLGKTLQMLYLAFCRHEYKTLIIVPNHIKEHWQSEILKHFNIHDFNEYILIVSYSEFATMDMELIKLYRRVIVDELHEMYAKQKAIVNGKIFTKLLECTHFIYRWGLTATPFVDSDAMFNIIKYLLGTKEIHNNLVGNYIMIQNQFKSVFRKNTKFNVEYELQLPQVEIHNILLNFNRYEQEIYNAEIIGNENKDTQFLRELCCNVLMSVCNDVKNVISLSDLKMLALNKFLEKVNEHREILDLLIQKRVNVEQEMKNEIQLSQGHSNTIVRQHYILEYENRIRHLDAQITVQQLIVERRVNVYESYKSITENIEEILGTNSAVADTAASAEADTAASAVADTATGSNNMLVDNNEDNDDDIDPEKMCPICYAPFSGEIVLFFNCRHYFCRGCFERCHALRPNQCPMCRSTAEVGEINFIGNKEKQFISTKNSEILKIIKTTTERFIIFTQFNKLIKSINNLLIFNGINALTYSEFASASQTTKDSTQVIILSSNVNASGIDLSFIHNVIIMEPFENYIYGKEIEKQLIGRVHRINQTHKVNVYRLIIKGTIEEEIYSM